MADRKKERQTESPSNLAPNLQNACENSGFITEIVDFTSQSNFYKTNLQTLMWENFIILTSNA
jgi:hypothetical protein